MDSSVCNPRMFCSPDGIVDRGGGEMMTLVDLGEKGWRDRDPMEVRPTMASTGSGRDGVGFIFILRFLFFIFTD